MLFKVLKIHLFILFVLAPLIGVTIAYLQVQPFSFPEIDSDALVLQKDIFQERLETTSSQLFSFKELTGKTYKSINTSSAIIQNIRMKAEDERESYLEHKHQLDTMLSASSQHGQASGELLDYLLANMLGDPIDQTFGERATVKVYSLQEVGYRGKMAKVRLHDVNALRMVLAEDQVGSRGETTRSAAERYDAVLGVNAGGHFFHEGKMYPLGITVVDGEIANFNPDSELSFVGFNSSGELVGGNISTREQIKEKEILQGASFLPTLLKNGEKQPIPADRANTRHPRTLIGHFKNGDLLFIVIDGRREGWSMGVTLEEAQEKLQEFNVRDAYNLDGGGSSTFYYDGKVLNRPSDGVERRVSTNIVVLP